MKFLTIYTMFAIPFVLVFTEAHKSINLLEFTVDICFLTDTILNFFKLGPDESEKDFKRIRLEYYISNIR